MILVRNIRLPLSAGEPQAFEKALHAARIRAERCSIWAWQSSRWMPATASPSWCIPWLSP